MSAAIRRILPAMTAAVMAMGITSCDGMIYDGEGDCDPYYKVRFRYDWNMKFADAFPNEVLSVTLYVIDDATGRIVWQKHESGDVLRSEGYMMDVDVAPGKYSLVAWCGEGHRSSFAVDDAGMKHELSCHLNVGGTETAHPGSTDPSTRHVHDDLKRLYHGCLEAQDFPDEQGVHVYTVSLKKNTNDVHVVLQHLSGEPVDANEYTFTITDTNGHMGWDNALNSAEPICYHAWWVQQGDAEIEIRPGMIAPLHYTPAGRVTASLSAAVADLTVGRLMKHNESSTRLNVLNSKGETIISIPLIKYCMMVKGHYRDMEDQEYLDRQDDYSMVFFLDEDHRWFDTYIYINSWKVTVQHEDL